MSEAVVSETLVSLVRQPRELMALVSRAIQDESGARCELVARPLAQAGESARGSGVAVAEAWSTLAAARLDDAAHVAAAVVVLLETVPWDRAGHLRGSLAAPRAWPAVREALEAQRRSVLRRLGAAGYDPRRLEAVAAARDPYAAYHHGATADAGLALLPRGFRTALLPLLRGRPWKEVLAGLRLHWELGLEHDPQLLALVVRLLATAPAHGPAWWAHLREELPERRFRFLHSVLYTGAGAVDPAGVPAAAWAGLAALDEEQYGDRLIRLLACLGAGHDVAHSLQLFRIADGFVPGASLACLWKPTGCGLARGAHDAGGIEPALTALLAHVHEAVVIDGYTTFPLRLWERCVQDAAFAGLLRDPALLAWPAATTYRLLRLMCYEHTVPPAEMVPAVLRLLPSVPDTHHAKAIGTIVDLHERWRPSSPHRRLLPAATALVARLARPPFGKDGGLFLLAPLLEAAGEAGAARLASAPDRCFQRLESAVRPQAGTWLLRNGFEALSRRARALVREAFVRHPDALFAAARVLGCLSLPRALALLGRFRAHPLLRRNLLRRPLDEVCRLIESHAAPGVPNPVPRRLREHLAGRVALSAASLEGHRQAIARGLVPVWLGLLRRMVLAELARGLPARAAAEEDERHALLMLGTVHEARRLLRRVLARAPGERREFLLGHPANRAWLRRHPRLDAALWIQGLEQTVDVGGQPCRLAVETEPLAVLRLGTEVGSCLSVGGCNSDSAVAVMTDVNKQVVFARRTDGTFVARQIVAVTDDDRLLFCPVYPLAAPVAVKDAFHAYDRALAEALGLRPFEQRGAEEYTVADILVRYSYDDGPWERFVFDDGAP